MDTLNSGTTLIIVGDGRNNYYDPRLDIFSAMSRRAVRTIWLNPEPPFMWHGDSDMPKYAPLCNNVLKVSNLRELADAVDTLMAG
ncbi:MAG: VWA domain-containing protein [Anaerolineales bacterium]|nr:VWA domain-containing protein [Anaerolineales bacterium]